MPSVLSVCEPLFNKTSRYWRTTPPVKPSRVAKALQSAAGKLPAGKKTGKSVGGVLIGGEEAPPTENESAPAPVAAASGNSETGKEPEKEPAQTH